ncbi:MAG: hypothetical protein HC876_20410, partial [Chloroflexaceae bacterium]|nr:hypothetical protein [Chloroflexaceae bacterium]
VEVGQQPVYIRQGGAVQSFAETPHSLRGPFLQYWLANGGLARLGLPISPVSDEQRAGGVYPTQWLERARLEYHAGNQPPYDMLLGLLGIETLEEQDIDWRDLPTIEAEQVPAGCRYFAETRHSLCPPFLAHWEQNGGLPVFGFPISEPLVEWTEDEPLLVQYFERNRFEHHPENVPPFDVLLGRLGAELMP